MKTYLVSVLCACLLAAESANAQQTKNDEIKFAFEVVRHGARAPLGKEFSKNFQVDEGILTASGMRQRYLLGRYARQRYTQDYKLFSEDYVPGQVYMQSTDILRTLQSGYSELLGLYPPGHQGNFTLTQEEYDQLNSGLGLPPMNVRDADQINADLGSDQLPFGFVSHPISTFMDQNQKDDVSYYGCAYTHNAVKDLEEYNEHYIDFEWMNKFVKPSLQTALQIDPEEMAGADFLQVYSYADAFISQQFEGVLVGQDTFDDNTWMEMRHYQTAKLEYMFTQAARRLTFSRMMRKPLAVMQAAVICQIVGCTDDGTLKYMVYSAHDDQLLNIMKWLSPINQEIDYVDFATQVAFELHADPECQAAHNDMTCFRVDVRYNGNELAFDGCVDSANENGTGCSYVDFLKYMQSIWFYQDGSKSLDAPCDEPYNRHATIGQNVVE